MEGETISREFTGSNPGVSVLLPVYNSASYLRESIESILNQSFKKYELLIICEPCTDNSSEIINSYKDSRIIHIQNEKRLGLANSLNKGIELARGEYIARMDADDVSLPERLARQVDFLETHPEIGVLGTGFHIMDGYGNTSHAVQFPMQDSVLRWCLCFYNPIVHPSVMMRRKIVEQAGGYSSDMTHAEDYDLWRRLSCVTRLSNMQDVLLHLRKHDANGSILNPPEEQRFSAQISSLMISHILNEEVSAGTVQRLWGQGFQTASDVRPGAELVYRLYQTIIVNDELSIIEKRAIRRGAAIQLCRLSRPWVKNASVWGVLARACYLDPFLVLRVAEWRLRRLFNMRSRPSRWSF